MNTQTSMRTTHNHRDAGNEVLEAIQKQRKP
jgi:hypothetical protein